MGKATTLKEVKPKWQVKQKEASVAAAPRYSDSFIPPGCDDQDDESDRYDEVMTKGHWCPPRLCGRNDSLVEAVNDWHFAMLNDSHRNQFYWDALAACVKGKCVMDIGSGSGLLAMMAVKLGAEKVVAIEASRDMVDLARLNAEKNGLPSDRLQIIHGLSSKVHPSTLCKADVIVSETLGALMLGEGMLDYMADARQRLGKAECQVVPRGGAQFAQLISSESLAMVSSVQKQCSLGFDLSAIGCLQDTGKIFFSKQWGFRMNTLSDLHSMSDRIAIFEADFQTGDRRDIPAVQQFKLRAKKTGVIHAVVSSWEVWSDAERKHKITTHPEDTKDQPWGFARDMQWGQGLQLIEDFDAANSGGDRAVAPAPFSVTEGEELLLTVRMSVPCRQTFQFTLQRVKADA